MEIIMVMLLVLIIGLPLMAGLRALLLRSGRPQDPQRARLFSSGRDWDRGSSGWWAGGWWGGGDGGGGGCDGGGSGCGSGCGGSGCGSC